LPGELRLEPSALTVVLHGELDLVTIERLRTLLDAAVSRHPGRLVIDLSDVPFVDVLSLSAMLAATDHVRDDGGIAVVRGASPSVRRMCALFNAGDVLPVDLPLPRSAVC